VIIVETISRKQIRAQVSHNRSICIRSAIADHLSMYSENGKDNKPLMLLEIFWVERLPSLKTPRRYFIIIFVRSDKIYPLLAINLENQEDIKTNNKKNK